MLSFAALSINRFLRPRRSPNGRRPATARRPARALRSGGERRFRAMHAIYAQSRLYLCVAMQPKPEALHAQRMADKGRRRAF